MIRMLLLLLPLTLKAQTDSLPMVIINGKLVSCKVTTIKGSEAVSIYGREAANGVIIIETKKRKRKKVTLVD